MRGGLVLRAALAGAALVLMIGGGFAALLIAIDDLRDAGRLAGLTQEELRAADTLEKTILDLETGVRGYVITYRNRFLEPWREGLEAFPERARRLVRLAETPAQQERARGIVEAGRAYIRDYAAPLVDEARLGRPTAQSVAATAEGERRMEAIRASFDRFVAAERALLTSRREESDEDARRAIAIAIGGLAGSVLLILVVGGYLVRAIVLPVRRAASTASELAEGNLGVRLPERGIGEIGELERAFNVMGSSLQESQRDLIASRARVVAAGDETRRRLERDLHDGAQQNLVHTLIALKLARRALGEGEDDEARKLVTEALGHGERANVELRELAHGILPAVLRRGGLRAGVEALASRLEIPVSIAVPPERLPPALEATAYFIVAEALTNVVKHAQARAAAVEATIDGGVLHVRVSDDGVGGASVEGGSGLLGLRDRAAAVGGELRIESPAGEGTAVTVRLPLPPDAVGSAAAE